MKIHIMNDFGVTHGGKSMFIDGLLEMISYSNREFEIKDLGLWRDPNWQSQSFLAPFNSVDWYVNQSLNQDRNQINAQHMLALFASEPWQDNNNHLDLFITKKDLFIDGVNFCLGLAIPEVGAIVSTNRFDSIQGSLAKECVKTITMHEFGHVLGIVPDYRKIGVNDSLGKHCTNTCIMRQGLNVSDWVRITNDRLNGNVLCELCQNDLLAISHYLN